MLNRISQWFEARKRRSVFRKSVAALKKQDDLVNAPKSLLDDLVYGWSEEDNPPTPFFLHAMLEEAKRIGRGASILMCGASLATLVLGIFAKKHGVDVWMLESNTTWFRRMKELLNEHSIDSVQMVYAPVRDYKSFSWYSVDRNDYPHDFSLIICDGPSGTVPGGRVGLYNVMYDYLNDKTLTLMNNVSDEESEKTLKIWQENLKVEVRMTSQDRSFVYVVFDKNRVAEAATEETASPDEDRSIYL